MSKAVSMPDLPVKSVETGQALANSFCRWGKASLQPLCANRSLRMQLFSLVYCLWFPCQGEVVATGRISPNRDSDIYLAIYKNKIDDL